MTDKHGGQIHRSYACPRVTRLHVDRCTCQQICAEVCSTQHLHYSKAGYRPLLGSDPWQACSHGLLLRAVWLHNQHQIIRNPVVIVPLLRGLYAAMWIRLHWAGSGRGQQPPVYDGLVLCCLLVLYLKF